MRSSPQDEVSHGVDPVRPLVDYEVDRPEVYARQRVQPTGTNRPRTWLLLALAIEFRGTAATVVHASGLAASRISRAAGDAGNGDAGRWGGSVSVATAEGKHPVPFRTRKLSPPAPMVLPWRRGGRVGRRRDFFRRAASGRLF